MAAGSKSPTYTSQTWPLQNFIGSTITSPRTRARQRPKLAPSPHRWRRRASPRDPPGGQHSDNLHEPVSCFILRIITIFILTKTLLLWAVTSQAGTPTSGQSALLLVLMITLMRREGKGVDIDASSCYYFYLSLSLCFVVDGDGDGDDGVVMTKESATAREAIR